MRTIEKTIYTFDELNDGAKEKVKNWIIGSGITNDVFSEVVMLDMRELFPHSDVKTQYSLSSCQGDGFNIYGEFSILDLIHFVGSDSNSDAIHYAKNIVWNYGEKVTFKANNRYFYSLWNISYKGVITNYFEDCYGNISEKNLAFDNLVCEKMHSLCKKYEDMGYSAIYDIDNDYVSEFCNSNDYEFCEDGSIYR